MDDNEKIINVDEAFEKMKDKSNETSRLNDLKKLLEVPKETKPVKIKKAKEKLEGLQPIDISLQKPKIINADLTPEQLHFIECFIPLRFNITNICAEVGISRTTYYDWLKDFPAFAKSMEALEMYLIDKSEEVLLQALDNGDAKTAQFILKALSPKYKDKVDITSNGQSLGTIINIIKPNE